MRNPVWILNIGLILVLISILGVVFFMKRAMPPRKSLMPQSVQPAPRQLLSPVDIRRIYENDLFKTYIAPITPEIQPVSDLLLPDAPALKTAQPLQPLRVQFLEPLKIGLKGIISSSDERGNRAIIADEKTKAGKEEMYVVGDTVEDAEIMRIDRNKVVFVRSNGQQETVFLTPQEASKDPLFAAHVDWGTVIHKRPDGAYIVDRYLFNERVTNVAQFIEMLDATTAFDKDIVLGFRVGQLPTDSLGAALGLQPGDIVTNIDGMPLKNRTDRVAAYQHIAGITEGAAVRVSLLRQQRKLDLLYTLQPAVVQSALEEPTIQDRTKSEIAQPPSHLKQMQQNDRAFMRAHGGRAAVLQRPVTT